MASENPMTWPAQIYSPDWTRRRKFLLLSPAIFCKHSELHTSPANMMQSRCKEARSPYQTDNSVLAGLWGHCLKAQTFSFQNLCAATQLTQLVLSREKTWLQMNISILFQLQSNTFNHIIRCHFAKKADECPHLL